MYYIFCVFRVYFNLNLYFLNLAGRGFASRGLTRFLASGPGPETCGPGRAGPGRAWTGPGSNINGPGPKF